MSKSPVETVTVDQEEFFCDGGSRDGSLYGAQQEMIKSPDIGHPRVFLTIGASGGGLGMAPNSIDCPYCGRHFVLAADAHKTGTH